MTAHKIKQHDHAFHDCEWPHKSASVSTWQYVTLQVEDKEGETPLSMAAKHGKLRDLMVQVATGKLEVDELL